MILSISIPHSYQYEQHQQVLNRCANIVAQFWMEYKSLFTCLLLTSVNFGVNVVIFTLSQTCFKLSALSPENRQLFIQVPVTSLTKHQQKPNKDPNDKPNSLKHVSHIELKLQ